LAETGGRSALADAMDDVTAKALLVDIAHNYELMAERFAKERDRAEPTAAGPP
jgi:hypothetical protein